MTTVELDAAGDPLGLDGTSQDRGKAVPSPKMGIGT